MWRRTAYCSKDMRIATSSAFQCAVEMSGELWCCDDLPATPTQLLSWTVLLVLNRAFGVLGEEHEPWKCQHQLLRALLTISDPSRRDFCAFSVDTKRMLVLTHMFLSHPNSKYVVLTSIQNWSLCCILRTLP